MRAGRRSERRRRYRDRIPSPGLRHCAGGIGNVQATTRKTPTDPQPLCRTRTRHPRSPGPQAVHGRRGADSKGSPGLPRTTHISARQTYARFPPQRARASRACPGEAQRRRAHAGRDEHPPRPVNRAPSVDPLCGPRRNRTPTFAQPEQSREGRRPDSRSGLAWEGRSSATVGACRCVLLSGWPRVVGTGAANKKR